MRAHEVGREVERWQSPDGKHLARLFTRGPGAVYFVELSELTEHGETGSEAAAGLVVDRRPQGRIDDALAAIHELGSSAWRS